MRVYKCLFYVFVCILFCVVNVVFFFFFFVFFSYFFFFFFFSSRRRHTRYIGDWSFRRVLFRSQPFRQRISTGIHPDWYLNNRWDEYPRTRPKAPTILRVWSTSQRGSSPDRPTSKGRRLR